MTSYVEGALIQGEEIVHLGHVSLWSLTTQILIGIFLLLLSAVGLVAIQSPHALISILPLLLSATALAFLIWAYVVYKTTELAITTKRIIAKSGFVSRQTIEINLAKIESLRVEQGILGRILNYGTIIVSGTGSHNAPVPNISNPMEFRKKFMEATDALQGK